MKRFMLNSVLVLAAMVFLAAPAAADTFNFGCITNTSAVNCATGQAQLTVNVTDAGGGQVAFTFSNSGPNAAVIAEIYFGYFGAASSNPNLIASVVSIGNVSGVNFVMNANPPQLPGQNNAVPPFNTIATLTMDATAPPPKNGIGAGESLTITVQLGSGLTFMDMINSLNFGNSGLGVHVIAFANGGSESFVTPPGTTPIPEPGTLVLFGSGLLGLAGAIRRKLAA